MMQTRNIQITKIDETLLCIINRNYIIINATPQNLVKAKVIFMNILQPQLSTHKYCLKDSDRFP